MTFAMSNAGLRSHRHAVIASGVVLLHVAALWALQSGLLRPALALVVPVQVLSAWLPAAVQPVTPPPPPAPTLVPKTAAARPLAAPVAPAFQAAAPLPVALADAAPTPAAPMGAVAPQPAAIPVAAAPAVSIAAPAKVELPSSDAQYLHNPAPGYPMLSRRAGEQGRVLVHVLIGADGTPQKADIKTSSGFERLDRAALATVLQWRYVPGKRGGVAEPMWFDVPINFVLE